MKFGKENIKFMQEMLELTFFPWQIKFLLLFFKLKVMYISGPRQFGKTLISIVVMLVLGLRGLSGAYTAHTADLVRLTFEDFLKLASPFQRLGLITKTSSSGNYVYNVYFSSGAVIYFRVRSSDKVIRGMTLDFIIWDEAQKLKGTVYKAGAPALTMSEYRFELFMGTPPTPKDYLDYEDNPFVNARKTAGKAWWEFTAADSYHTGIAISVANARKANPSWRAIPDFWGYLKEKSANMSHLDFCQEFMGVWYEPDQAEIHDPYWTEPEVTKILTRKDSDARQFTAALGVLHDVDEAYVAFNDGLTVEVSGRFDLSEGNFDDLITFLRNTATKYTTLNIPANSRGKAIAQLMDAARMGKKVKLVTLPMGAAAINRFLKQAEDGTLKVVEAPDTALALSSFWVGLEEKSREVTVKAGVGSDIALMLALAYSTTEKTLVERASTAKAFAW